MAYSAMISLLERLSRLIVEKPPFLRGVEVQVNFINSELSWIKHNFLEKYFDKELDEHEIVGQYRRQILDIVFDVEDFIDMVILKGATAKHRRIEVAEVLDEVAMKINDLNKNIKKMATNIENIRMETAEAGVDPTVEETLHKQWRDVEEDDVVGFAHHSAALIEQLTKGELAFDVISIVGMNGLGKTTLAKKIFNNDCVKRHFDCLLWACASPYDGTEMLLEILEEVPPVPNEFPVVLDKRRGEWVPGGTPSRFRHLKSGIQEKLDKCLRQKRYLVVLDDIWSIAQWRKVELAFRRVPGLEGSRILITTSIEALASLLKGFNPPYFLPVLNSDESWQLFHKTVFREGSCPPELASFARGITRYCHGLPYSIVVFGGLLAQKEKRFQTWLEVIAELDWSITEKTTICEDILTLSYAHLPQHLKPCLLHMGKYREGFEIPVGFLIQQWINLGFIQHDGKGDMGDVAKGYLKELIDRSLIQVISTRPDGEVEKCCIHHLVEKLCISKSPVERAETSVDVRSKGALDRYTIDVVRDYSTVVKQLTEGNTELELISIIGAGGLGKTTLARYMYNYGLIKSHFNCRVWVCVSQNFRTREFLLEILKHWMPKLDDMTRKLEDLSSGELRKKLSEYLQRKRYLVVMDDICITQDWDEIRSAFPDNFNGSRILITSRIQEVASYASLTPYFLPPLNKDESWELFRKKVFDEGKFPALKFLGRQLVESCSGLPLSLVVLGGLLGNKGTTCRTWSKVITDVYQHKTKGTVICKHILDISYAHLPRRLKLCFLYLGVYPKDFQIPARQLIQLWIAEGLISDGVARIEDVAELYLEELIDRNLIQVVERRSDGRAKTCHIHDLLRDLCISKAAEENYFDVPRNVNLSTWKKSRRLSIQGSTLDQYLSSKPSGPSCARSLLFFGQDTYRDFDPNHWKWIQENFNLVRVLNMGHLNVYSIPMWIKKLIHLRYLSVESETLKVIPASIGNLRNLETLDLRGTFLNCLPIEIWKLRNLRNLHMSGPVSLPNPLDTADESLPDLQVLSTVSCNQQFVSPRFVNKFPSLEKLGLWFASDESRSEVNACSASYVSGDLKKLKIINCSQHSSLWRLTARLTTKLTLRLVCLEDGGIMTFLGVCSNLQILKLQSCLLSCELHVDEDSFLRLEVLKLENLRIKEWKQGEGAMPKLRHLVIDQCFELKMLPWELCSLKDLRKVEVLESKSVSTEFLQELKRKVWIKVLIDPPLDTFVAATPKLRKGQPDANPETEADSNTETASEIVNDGNLP